jgi:hypothetical protein
MTNLLKRHQIKKRDHYLYMCYSQRRANITCTDWTLRDTFPEEGVAKSWIAFIHEYEPWNATKVERLDLSLL